MFNKNIDDDTCFFIMKTLKNRYKKNCRYNTIGFIVGVFIEKPWKDHFFFMSMYKTIQHDKIINKMYGCINGLQFDMGKSQAHVHLVGFGHA